MSDKDENQSNSLDLTSEMTDQWDNELNESELLDPEEHDSLVSPSVENTEEKPEKSEVEKTKSLEKEDEDEDEDEDDYEETGSLLSTKSGKILAGAGAFGLTVVGIGGYFVFNAIIGGPQMVAEPPVQKAAIKPIYEEDPVLIAASEEKQIEAQPVIKKSDPLDYSDLTQKTTPVVATTEVTDAQIDSSKVVSNNELTSKKDDLLPSEKINIDFPNIQKKALIANAEVKDTQLAISKNELEKAVTNNSKSDNNSQNEIQVAFESDKDKERFDLSLLEKEPLGEKSSSEIVSEKQDKVIVSNVATSKKDKPEVDTEKALVVPPVVQNGISEESVSKIVNELVSKNNVDKDNKLTALEKKVDNLTKLLEEKTKEDKNVIVESGKVDPALLGRERLKGFKIINTTMDGSMSVVKAPSGRTIILYKGEKFYIKDKGSFVVSEVLNNGKLLLANKHYFIDDVYEELPKASKIEKKVTPEKKVIKKEVKKESVQVTSEKLVKSENNTNSDNFEQIKNDTVKVNVAKLVDNIRVTSTKELAKNWSWNGQMGNEYIIQSPNGEWELVKAGDTVEGLGIVNGLSDNNSLIIGNFVVAKAED